MTIFKNLICGRVAINNIQFSTLSGRGTKGIISTVRQQQAQYPRVSRNEEAELGVYDPRKGLDSVMGGSKVGLKNARD